MALFLVRHRHDPNRCPARHPAMGAMLLDHVGKTNATNEGVTIHGKVMIDGSHTLYMIIESEARETVEHFMAPFGQLGELEVLPATSCEDVVARGYD